MQGVALCLGQFEFFYFFGGGWSGGGHIGTFSVFLSISVSWESYVFSKFCGDIPGITLAITQKAIWYVAFILEGCFKVF